MTPAPDRKIKKNPKFVNVHKIKRFGKEHGVCISKNFIEYLHNHVRKLILESIEYKGKLEAKHLKACIK